MFMDLLDNKMDKQNRITEWHSQELSQNLEIDIQMFPKHTIGLIVIIVSP